MRRTPLTAAAGLLLGLALAGCSGGEDDKTEAELVDDLSAVIESDERFDADAADCLAQIVVDEVGVDELQDLDLADDEPSAEVGEAIAAAAQRAADECDITPTTTAGEETP